MTEPGALGGAPVVVEVQDVRKAFAGRAGAKPLQALRGASFSVHRGEFFGIVGRNGSGKSTLLKILASIYRADAGRVRIAGRLAPFIELGVGFDPELTARENVTINGVMMGLGRREAARRLDAVLDFAELRDHVNAKLKNYSSGMLVRLAFSAMVEADADVMLVDEVLAVGDAAFAQKCLDVFRAKRAAGRTIILVTHDMGAVHSFCDRAMLLHDGEQRFLGDAEEAARRYLRLNFGGRGVDEAAPEAACRVVDARLEDERGRPCHDFVQGSPLHLAVTLEAREELAAPAVAFEVVGGDGIPIFGFASSEEEGAESRALPAGGRLRVRARADNPLVPGHFLVNCVVSREHDRGDVALRITPLAEFEVRAAGTRPVAIEEHEVGMVSARGDVRATLERA